MSDTRHLIDAELEAVVLGTILHDGEPAYRQVRDVLVPHDFGVEKHRRIYTVVQQIGSEVSPSVDAVTHALTEAGKLDSVDGLTGLMDLHERAISGSRLEGFAHSLKAKSDTRRALGLTEKLGREIELHGLNGNRADVAATAKELIALTESDIAGGRVLSIESLPAVTESQEPVRYIIEPELPEGAIVALTGDSGSGKSTLATAWARDAIASGRPALILDRENPRSVAMDRMTRLGVQDNPFLRWAGGWCGDVPGPDSAVIITWVRACDPKPVVVIDSLAAFLGGDENSASDMRRFMNGARRLADLGAAVVPIHHDGKAETARDFRGSSDFKASVDQAFHVTNTSLDPGKLDRLRLRCFKSRFGLSSDLVYRYADGRMLRDQRPDAPARTVADQLTDLLRQHPGVGSREFEELAVKNNLGRQRSRDYLADGVLAGVIRREDAGRNRYRHYLAEVQ